MKEKYDKHVAACLVIKRLCQHRSRSAAQATRLWDAPPVAWSC